MACVAEVGGKELSVCSCRHEDDFDGTAMRYEVPQQQQRQVHIYAALMHLINDYMADALQGGVS